MSFCSISFCFICWSDRPLKRLGIVVPSPAIYILSPSFCPPAFPKKSSHRIVAYAPQTQIRHTHDEYIDHCLGKSCLSQWTPRNIYISYLICLLTFSWSRVAAPVTTCRHPQKWSDTNWLSSAKNAQPTTSFGDDRGFWTTDHLFFLLIPISPKGFAQKPGAVEPLRMSREECFSFNFFWPVVLSHKIWVASIVLVLGSSCSLLNLQ